VRHAVDEALQPVQQGFRELLRRIEELERRPATTTTIVAAAPSPVAVSTAPAVSEAHRMAQPSYSAAIAASIPITVSLAPRAPVLDVAAIERDASIDVDGALDGRRRKRRLALTFVLLLLVVFGGLFAALARSYSPHQSMRDAPGAPVRPS
jgi:hypothetical protein